MTVFRKDLLETFKRLQKDFNQALKDAQAQEQAFNQACQTFQTKMAEHIKLSREKVSDSNPMTQPLDIIKKVLEETNQKWDEKIKNRDKGVSFRAGFNDSLLVFAYGKVKSGKSSLGNYMAWGNTDPTDTIKAKTPTDLHPIYFSGERTQVKSGDGHKEAESNKEFRVGATEATSTIQGFSLSGLTWIDSPGLHSVNAKNGELAKQYVEHSDLILYTMKSDSPGRESDIEEITKLYRADKKIVLLITGSDDIEEDWDDSINDIVKTIVMKEPDRRKRQIEYVRQTLENLPELRGKTDNIEIISFSARYAQLHGEEASEFYDSGMGQLFATLQKIATQDGVKLKQQVPMRNFSHFMKSFANDVIEYKNSIQEFQKPINRIERDVPSAISKSIRELQRQLSDWIDKEFALLESSDRENIDVMQKNLKAFGEKLKQHQANLVIAEQSTLLQNILKELQDGLWVCIQDNQLFEMPEFALQTHTKQIENFRAGNKRIYAAIGGLIGGVVGLWGGPMGAAIGGTVGGLIGNAIGDDDTVTYKDIIVNTGDNLINIKLEIRRRMNESIKNQMQKFESQLIGIAIDNIKDLDDAISQEISNFENSLNKINSDIAQYLNDK